MAFNPVLETQISPVQAVTQPNAASGIANLAQLFAPRPKPQPSQTDLKAQATSTFFSEMEKARQMREDGNPLAEQTALNAYRQQRMQFGTGIEGADEAYATFSGQDIGMVNSGNLGLEATTRQNPEYQNQLMLLKAGNPDMPDEQLDQEAIRATTNVLGNKAALTNLQAEEGLTWVKAKPVFDRNVQDARDDLQKQVNLIKQDGIVSMEEAQQIRSYWQQKTASFAKPPGIPEEVWQKYKSDNIDTLNEVVNFGLGIADFTKGDSSKDLPRALNMIVDQLIAQGKLPPALRMNLMEGSNDPMGSLQTALQMLNIQGGIDGTTWEANIQSAMKLDYKGLLQFAQTIETADASYVDNIDVKDFVEGDDKGKTQTLTVDKVRASSSDLGTAAEGLISLIEHSAAVPDDVFAGSFMRNTFDENFFTQLDRLEDLNPAVGKRLKERASEMLATRQASMEGYVTSVARQNGFEIKQTAKGYDFVLSPNLMTEGQKAELDKYFGGSITAAMAARGVFKAVAPGSMGMPANVTPNLWAAFKDLNNSKQMLEDYGYVMGLAGRLKEEEAAPQGGSESVAPAGMEFQMPEEIVKDTAFVNGIKAVSEQVGIQPDWLARAIAFETGNTWSPSVRNPGSSATGLIQFMSSTAKDLGVTTDQLANMTRDQQMVYVGQYLEPYKGKIKNFGDLYMAIHYPAAIGKDDTYVLYREGGAEYKGNRNLDTNNDGTVTRAEAVARAISGTSGNIGVQAVTGAGYQGPSTGVFPNAPENVAAAQAQVQPSLAPTFTDNTQSQISEKATELPTETPMSIPEAKGAPTKASNKEIQKYLNSLVGQENGITNFDSEEALKAAIASGKVESGDLVAVAGKVRIVE